MNCRSWLLIARLIRNLTSTCYSPTVRDWHQKPVISIHINKSGSQLMARGENEMCTDNKKSIHRIEAMNKHGREPLHSFTVTRRRRRIKKGEKREGTWSIQTTTWWAGDMRFVRGQQQRQSPFLKASACWNFPRQVCEQGFLHVECIKIYTQVYTGMGWTTWAHSNLVYFPLGQPMFFSQQDGEAIFVIQIEYRPSINTPKPVPLPDRSLYTQSPCFYGK